MCCVTGIHLDLTAITGVSTPNHMVNEPLESRITTPIPTLSSLKLASTLISNLPSFGVPFILLSEWADFSVALLQLIVKVSPWTNFLHSQQYRTRSIYIRSPLYFMPNSKLQPNILCSVACKKRCLISSHHPWHVGQLL